VKIVEGQLRLSASDLSNFLACRYLSRLDNLHAHKQLKPQYSYDIGLEQLTKRGDDHEQRVLDGFLADGLDVVEIPRSGTEDERAEATREALRSGVQIIFQGVLKAPAADGRSELLGRPDFLVRADAVPTADGEPPYIRSGYEVVDAKLARTAKARAVLQTTFYSYLLSQLQEAAPTRMHLALGNGEFTSLPVSDYAAYERRIRALLEEFVAADAGAYPPADPYPEPVEHCAICRWSPTCTARRRADDDLSLVAGMPVNQRVALKALDVGTRRGFAALDELPRLGRADPASLQKAHLQAKLQVRSEDAGEIEYQLLEPERKPDGDFVPNRGLLALPEPTVGDLFFDIEGARYYSEDAKEFGLQYLFGIVDTADLDHDGKPRYTTTWAFDRSDEKRAFEELIDFMTERRARNPGLHVYHYNHYEPTSLDHLTELHGTREEALGRLMGRFATREDELDDLFRLGVFVDLYRVVRQAVRAGVESYSIKRLEPLIKYQRQVDLRDATSHLIAFEAALDEATAAHEPEDQSVVAGYNEDDCRATLVLRAWLEERRPELAARLGTELPRPVVEEAAHGVQNEEVARLKEELLANVPDDVEQRSPEDKARALLADVLEWHRREAKPAWWLYFRLKTLSGLELVGERAAIGELRGGDNVGQEKKSVVRRFTFPAQEHGFDVGDKASDPVTGTEWTVCGINEEGGTIDLKIGMKSEKALPSAIIGDKPFPTAPLEESLRRRQIEAGERGTADADRAEPDEPGDLHLHYRPLGLDTDRVADREVLLLRRAAVDHDLLPVWPGAVDERERVEARGAVRDAEAEVRRSPEDDRLPVRPDQVGVAADVPLRRLDVRKSLHLREQRLRDRRRVRAVVGARRCLARDHRVRTRPCVGEDRVERLVDRIRQHERAAHHRDAEDDRDRGQDCSQLPAE